MVQSDEGRMSPEGVKNAGLSRRRMLKTMFCSSVLLSMNIDVRKLRAADGVATGDMHWLMVGDFGTGGRDQKTVAAGMSGYVKHHAIAPAGLLLLGDNFYGHMTDGLKSKRWADGFETMYPKDVFPGQVPVVLGNHDYHDNPGYEKVQLEYTKTPGTRWWMPDHWFRMDYPKTNPLVTMLFIDTNLPNTHNTLGHHKEHWPTMSPQQADEQWAWLKKELASPRGKWTIVAGHHPVHSDGQHGDTAGLVKTLAPMLQEHDVAMYLCGHDHDMQHLELDGMKTSFVVSGAGGAGVRPLKSSKRNVFGRAHHGFSHLAASEDRLVLRHLYKDGKQLHAFEKYPDGRFKILSA